MSKTDFHVIAFRILTYFYACMKEGEYPKPEEVSHERLGINKGYWVMVFKNLLRDGHITGVSITKILGTETDVEFIEPMITSSGIEYLNENSFMYKAKEFLKEIKEIVPGI